MRKMIYFLFLCFFEHLCKEETAVLYKFSLFILKERKCSMALRVWG